MDTHSREQHDVPLVKVHHMFSKSSIDCILPAYDRTNIYELHYVSVQNPIRRIAWSLTILASAELSSAPNFTL